MNLRIKEILKDEGCWNVDIGETYVGFECSGNKGVNYDFLEQIKTLLKEHQTIKEFEIRTSEYVEGDEGYWYSSADDLEDEKNAAELSHN